MKICGAALANRFYARDGWTRGKVVALLADPKQKEHVEPRYFAEDPKVAYYAVYNHGVSFLASKIAGHEYVPFNLGGGVSPCDEKFESKNNVVDDLHKNSLAQS